MEQDDLAVLSDQQQETYNAYRRIFESDAWYSLMEYVKQQSAFSAARQLAAQSWEHFLIAKGERLSYTEIANLETAIENENLTLVAELRAQRLAADEGEHE